MKTSVWLIGLLAALLILPACKQKEEAPAAPQQQAQPASQAAAPRQEMPGSGSMAMGDMALGEKIYDESCKNCHGEGIAGAPKVGDQSAWVERIAQGMDTLNQKSINGFTGKTGTMPAKGGNAALSDDEVKAAVAFMVEHSK